MSFYLSDKDYKEMIGIISGNTGGKKGGDTGGTYIDMPAESTKPEQQGILADTVDAVQMGAWKGISDIAHGVGALTGADWLHKVGDWAGKGADENLATMSDEMKVALNQNAFDGEDQGIRNVRWWAGNLGSLIGQNLDTVLTLGAGKAATFGVKQAGKMLLKKEAAEEVGKVAVEQAAKRGIPQKYWNMVGITATMSAMSSGSRYSQKRDDVMAMTNEQLSQIPQFSDAYYEIADSEEGKGKTVEQLYDLAKASFADKVGRDAALNPAAIATDLSTNAVSGLGGGFWGLGSPAKTINGGLLKGAMVEGGTEAIQGVGEQYALNKAEQDNYNPNKDLTEGMADNAINGAVLGGVFGSAMGGLDTYTDRRAFNNQKRILLNHINTGNEAIDSQLKNYVDMLNQGAADLGDLVSASRVQALNNAGIANARVRQAEEDARAQQQANAQFESDFFGEEQVAQPNQPKFKIDPQMERAVYVAKAIEKFRKGDLSGANEFISEPMVFTDNATKSQFVIDRGFGELKNIAEAYGLNPKDGKAIRQWIEDYIAKAREYNANYTETSQTVNHDPQAQAGNQSNSQPSITHEDINNQIAQDDMASATRYSFAGENAQTANKELLTKAKSAVESGLDPEVIRQETGWFKGADGKWRFELDDSDINFKDTGSYMASHIKSGVKLGDLIQADKLFNAYPDLKNITVKASADGGIYYSPKTDEIFFDGGEMVDNAKGSLLHEVQHAIQQREGFAQGGSPSEFRDINRTEMALEGNKNRLRTLLGNNPKEATVYSEMNRLLKQYQGFDNMPAEIEQKYDSLLGEMQGEVGRNILDLDFEIRTAQMRLREGNADILTAEDQYRRLAGEVEAKNVQLRLPLTEEQRKAFSPKDTQGIPDEQQRVRYGYGINHVLNESANSDFAKAVDKIASGEAVAKYINVGTTPSVLKMLGLPDVRVTISGQVLNKVMLGKHNVTQETLKQLPNQINNPVAVMKSRTQENGYVVLTELVEREGGKDKPVIAALHLKKTNQGLELISIASVYGRSNTQIQRGLERDLLYWNKTKGSQFLTAFGLQLPSHMQSDASLSLNHIKTEADLSQYQSAKNNQESTANPDIQRTQEILRQTFGEAAEHIEVTTFANPPKDVKNLITSDVEGWFNPKAGKITIVADSIKPTKTMTKDERLQFVAWHEMAHRGINVGYKGTYDNLMAEVGKNKAVSQIADAIQNQRKSTDDLAATNRTVAIEEAIAEIMAANETGKWNELESRYGVEIKKGQRQSTKSWLAMTAQRIKEFLSKIFGAERAAQFSDEDVLNLIVRIKEKAIGKYTEVSSVDNGVRYSIYHRRNNNPDSPDNGVGYSMFAEDEYSVEHYGENHWILPDGNNEKRIYAGSGEFKNVLNAWLNDNKPLLESEFGRSDDVLIDGLIEESNPEDIVDSAGFWDNEKLVRYFNEEVLAPNGWEIVETRDGAISFNDELSINADQEDDVRYSTSGESLPMDLESRLARAKEQGFDTEYFYRHGTYQENPIERIRPDESFGALFTLKNDFADLRPENPAVGNRYEDFIIKGEPMTHQEFNDKLFDSVESMEEAKDLIAKDAIIDKSSLSEEEWENVLDVIAENKDLTNLIDREYDGETPEYLKEVFRFQGEDDVGYLNWGAQRLRIKLAKKYGANAIEMEDEYGISIALLPGNGIRSVEAEFNPSKTDSDNLRFSRSQELTEERYNQAKENGETELTFHQWQQVRSPEFKAWFGDWENDPENSSKVINQETGEPLVVYHGSNANFTIFDKSKIDIDNLGAGFYFSSEDIANSYANRRTQERGGKENTYAVYLKMEKPLDFRNVTHEQAVEANKQEFLSFGFDEAEAQRQAEELVDGFIADTKRFNEKTDFAIALPDNKSEGMQRFIKNESIDGFIVPGRDKASGKDGVAYVVFEPHQIKSATNNNGDFSSENADIRFSRANTAQSALDLSQTAKAESEPSLWDDLKAKDHSSFKERFNRAMGKVDEWLADSLRPVNDWIDSMHLEDQTGNTSSRDHEKRRLKDAMYTAKGKRDALNSELEQAYLKPILSKIAALSKETKKSKHPIDELTMKRLVGNWISARYSIEKNIDLLNRDEKVMRDTKRLLDNAKQNGTSAEVRRLNDAYLKAKEQYDNRKADIYNTDYKNKGKRFKVGVAGGWSIPEAELILKNTERRISKSDLESVAEMVYDLNQARLEIDRASGRYTEKEYQEYKANRHYVPLTGDPNADVDTDIISGAGSSAVNIGRDKALKGRTSSEAEDAIDAMWKSVGKSTTYAGFSEFKGKIDDLYETEVTMLKEKGYSDSQAREQATANLGISKRKMQGLTRSSDNVLIRKEGGEYYEYELPKQAMEALRNDNVEHANAFLKLISKPTGWYARGVTQWTVTFAPMNMMRDTWEKSEFIRVQKLYDKNNRLVDSKTMDKIGRATIANAFTDKEVWQATKRLGFGQELRDSVPAERMLKQLLKEGGVSNYGTYLDKSEVDLIKRLKKENNPIAGKLEKAGKVLEGYNKMFDTVSALAAYKALVENGIDSKQAAATTLELTNFRKTGSKMRGIKALYMFSQPTVMGAANLIRYLSTRKGQVRFVAYLAGMTALYTVLRSMDDDDEGGNKMDQLGDITRYIPIPIGGGHYFKIPVGFGMPQMAWNFSTNIVKGAVSDISLTEAGVNMLAHSLKTFAPVSPSEISASKYPMEKITLTATPTILQPLMQNVLNRSAFGSKITTNYVREDKLKAEQSKATTAQFWKDTALFMNDNLGIDMHPEQIKNLFDGYSPMFGSLKELNTVLVENPNRETLGRNTRIPFLNQFIGTTNEFSIQSRYYEASGEAGNVAKEYESRKARGELGDWLDDDKRKLIKFHEEDASIVGKMRSEKAKLTRALRAGQISAVAYENGIKRYNKDMSRVQAQMLRKYRMMEGLNTN